MKAEEKNEMISELIEQMKSIPQLGILYDTVSKNMPGIMEAALKETFDNFHFDEKITNEEIINRCENLLLEFYDYYNISWERFVDEHGIHKYIPVTSPESAFDYQSIWKVIISAQNDEIKKLGKSDFTILNKLHKKYKENKCLY